MNDRFGTERAVMTWFDLEDPGRAPDGLLDDVLRTTSHRTTRPRWLAARLGHHVRAVDGRPAGTRRLRAIAVAAASLLAVAAGAALIGSGSLGLSPADFTPSPSASVPSQASEPSPAAATTTPTADPSASAKLVFQGCADATHVAMPAEGATSLASVRQTLQYVVPAGLRLQAVWTVAYVSFRNSDSSRGLRRAVDVADISDLVLHGSLVYRPYLGTDAASFLEDLDETPEYTVTNVVPTRLGPDLAALAATVSMVDPGYGWTHLDRLKGDRTCGLEFGVPHRLLVADVGESTIAVQIWAETDEELQVWLPTATELVDTFRFEAAP